MSLNPDSQMNYLYLTNKPVIGLGNSLLAKYSMVGHVSPVTVLFQEAIHEISQTDPDNKSFAHLLTRPLLCKKLNLFPHEFFALRLVLVAKETIRKIDTDYRIASFCNLFEW
jgi:hypothetical protein